MKTIVVSAVNLRKGGTLSILRQCLEYLSDISQGRPVPPRLRTWDSVFEDPQPDSGIAGTHPGGDFGPYEQEPLGCAPQKSGSIRVIALVHSRQLCDYPGIEYIEMPWCIRTWAHRLWAEYVTMLTKWAYRINVPCADPKAIADAIMDICSDPATYGDYCRCARKRYEEMFTLDRMIDNAIKLYESCLR